MLPGLQGRESGFDILLNGKPYQVARDEKGAPIWRVGEEPAVLGKGPARSGEEKTWSTWHLGCGERSEATPGAYRYGKNVDTRIPRQVTLGPLVQLSTDAPAGIGPTSIFEFPDNLGVNHLYFFGHDTHLYEIHLAADADWLRTTTRAPDLLATKALVFDGVCYFSGDPAGLQSWTSAGVHTTLGPPCTFMATYCPDTDYVFVRAYQTGTQWWVTWCPAGSNPMLAASYGAAYRVGDSTTAITGMVGVDRTLFVAKTDGLYYVDASGRTPRLFGVSQYDGYNGWNIYADSLGYVWYPCKEALYRYDPRSGTVADCTPMRGLSSSDATLRGRVNGIVQHRNWYYCLVVGTKSHIYVGRLREQGEAGEGPMVWHGPIIADGTGGAIPSRDAMLVTGVIEGGRPMLCFNRNDSGIAFANLPAEGDNPLADSGYQYCASGELRSSDSEWTVPGTSWYPLDFTFDNEALSAPNQGLTAGLYINGGDLLGGLGTTFTPGQTTLTVPVAGTWQFNRAALNMVLYTLEPLKTPVIRAATGRAVRRPNVNAVISTRLYCSDRVAGTFGLTEGRAGITQVQNLIAIQEGVPVELVDWWTGAKRTRRVLVLPITETVVAREDGHGADQAVDVTLLVVYSPLDEVPVA